MKKITIITFLITGSSLVNSSSLINEDSTNAYLKIGSATSQQCIIAGAFNQFDIKPCTEATPDWSYSGQQLKYDATHCLTIEQVTGGYSINGKLCDNSLEQIIDHVGNKFFQTRFNLCLTGEGGFVGVRGIDTCSFKSPWQDFDTPSNLFLVETPDQVVFDFDNSPVFRAVTRPFLDPVSIPIHPFYENKDKWFKQTQYPEAYDVAKGHIFQGDAGVTILQTDDSVPSITNYPQVIGAADVPPGGHADNVAGILYDCQFGDQYYNFYMGCLMQVKKTALAVQDVNDALRNDAHDWRTIDTWINDVFPSGIPSVYNASVANAFFVLSNSDNISHSDLSVRMGDYVLDKFNILGVTSQPGSYTDVNNTVSGNLYNALVVGNLDAGINYGAQSGLDNTDGYPRSKPDIVTFAQNAAASSSWATPTVSNLAAGLFSVAKTDDRFALARYAETVAAIIMAGAVKDSEVPTQLRKWDPATQMLEPWIWSQALPQQPLDKVFGVGMMNYLRTYQIFFSGPYQNRARNNGWDSQIIHVGEEKIYLLGQEKINFSSVLYWNRKITATGARELVASLSRLQLELLTLDGRSVALSDGRGNNRQHIFLKNLPQDTLKLVVRNQGPSDVRYGIAWRTGMQPNL